MGICHSKRTVAETSLYRTLPGIDTRVGHWKGNKFHFERWDGWHAFYSEQEKRSFAEMIIFVMSENGKYNLDDLRFEVYYTRSPDTTKAQIKAAFVAKDGNAVRHTFLGEHYGNSKSKAFAQLKIEVEQRANLLLRGETSTGRRSPPSTIHHVAAASEARPNDQQPPPYSAGIAKATS